MIMNLLFDVIRHKSFVTARGTAHFKLLSKKSNDPLPHPARNHFLLELMQTVFYSFKMENSTKSDVFVRIVTDG
jgi:hypothetical protein